MSRQSESVLVPRNGHSAVVEIVARISGCANQKEVSLEDQVDHGKEEVGYVYKGPTKFQVIQTTGKGERLDRPELAEIEKLLRSKTLDLLVMEDIGRLVRGSEAMRLCGIAVDHGTRVIAPNDGIDTADEHWEEDVLSACRDHTSNQTHTSKRIKKKLMSRFMRSGEIMSPPIAGYIKPQGAKCYADWRKDETATAIIQTGLRMLRETLLAPPVADYFNEQGFQLGPSRRKTKKWNGRAVLEFYRNPLLKGMPARGRRHTIKHHESGRRVAVRNPNGPNYRHEPHLAHVEPAELDEVLALLEKKNNQFRRSRNEDEDPRFRTPRKRTRSFGQHARCWYCGRHYNWGANGLPNRLMCSGAREYKCWNSLGFNGPLAAKRLVDAIITRLERVDDVDQQFQELIRAAQRCDVGGMDHRWETLRRDEKALNTAKNNMMAGLAEYGPSPMIKGKLAELDERETCLVAERHYLETAENRTLQLPESTGDLSSLLQDEFRRRAIDTYEFGELVRQLAPDFHVYLVRLIDGGHPLPRAKVRLNLLGNFADAALVPELGELLAEEITLDLFEPPQREAIREEAVRLTAEGLEQRQVAASLAEKPTQTAVWKALQLHKRMLELQLKNPYVMLSEPPGDYAKLRRYKNKRYRFEMLEGYVRPTL